MLKNLFALNLKMFDGGATASGDGATGAAAPTDGEANVVYGKQAEPAAADVQTETTPPPRDMDAEFADMIKGEYKDAYRKETQKMINSRFAKYKGMQSELARQESLIAVLQNRYGETDFDKLKERIENDSRLVSDKAIELGVTDEQMLEIEKIKDRAEAEKRERERYERAYNDYVARENADRQYAQWISEGDGLKNLYPNFDLETECMNNQFMGMLRNGVSVKAAYEAIHHDEIVKGYVQNAVKDSAKATAQNIASRGTRPRENGTGSGSATIFKTDVTKLTAKDREDIARRVARGEKISF